MDQRAYLHLTSPSRARASASSAFSPACTCTDAERHLIEVLETDIQRWKAGSEHEIRVQWDVDDGVALLWMDGEEKDRGALNRRLSGAFK